MGLLPQPSIDRIGASMKVPPKRKGNPRPGFLWRRNLRRLNESPSEKEGKCLCLRLVAMNRRRLNESPSEKEGKWCAMFCVPSSG